jgi:hypothetical protein
MDITQVLTKRFPDAEWTLNGDSLLWAHLAIRVAKSLPLKSFGS